MVGFLDQLADLSLGLDHFSGFRDFTGMAARSRCNDLRLECYSYLDLWLLGVWK